MTTITINERTKKGKSLLEYLRKFEGEDFINIEEKPNAKTKRAIRQVQEGKVTRYDSVEDMMNKLDERKPGKSLLKSIEEARTGKTKEMGNIEDYFNGLRKRANV